jgi:hypothetical protein
LLLVQGQTYYLLQLLLIFLLEQPIYHSPWDKQIYH